MDSHLTQAGHQFKSEGSRCAVNSLESTVVVAFRPKSYSLNLISRRIYPQSQPITLYVDSQADLKALNSKVGK